MELTEGTKAPAFTATDQNGQEHALADYAGKWVLLYFYPKDDTPGCTKEACGFRDLQAELADKNCAVLGVSKDTVDSHTKFANKFELNFPILADPELKICKAYGAWQEKAFMGRPGVVRISYLIDPEGNIAKAYGKVKAEEHPAEVLQDLP